jgi:hypothetical protein
MQAKTRRTHPKKFRGNLRTPPRGVPLPREHHTRHDFGYLSQFTFVCDIRFGGMHLGCPGFVVDILVSSSVPRLLGHSSRLR